MKSTVIIATLAAISVSSAAFAVDVQQLYDSKCKVCHSIGAEAGPMAQVGGALDGVGTKRDEAWIRAYLLDPPSRIDNAKMKPVVMPDDEFNAIVQYMLSLK